jgi:aryl-alcohol dehydrogenase-like predicted oxidoreductase
MEYRRLGNSGLLVSELSLGTMIFGERSERSTPPGEAERMIHRFLDVGATTSTRPMFTPAARPMRSSAASRDRRDGVVLATKVRFPTGKGPNDAGSPAITS